MNACRSDSDRNEVQVASLSLAWNELPPQNLKRNLSPSESDGLMIPLKIRSGPPRIEGGSIVCASVRLASCVEELPLASHGAQGLLCVSGTVLVSPGSMVIPQSITTTRTCLTQSGAGWG